jgi:hypothetical protein
MKETDVLGISYQIISFILVLLIHFLSAEQFVHHFSAVVGVIALASRLQHFRINLKSKNKKTVLIKNKEEELRLYSFESN